MKKRDNKKFVVYAIGLIILICFLIIFWGNMTGNAVWSNNCADSDNGINYDEKGVVTLNFFGGGSAEYPDTCSSSPQYNLIERYCDNKKFIKRNSYYKCAYGCENGACKLAP